MLEHTRTKKEAPETAAPREKADHSGNVQEIKTAEQFNAALKQGKPVIADFFAPWCGPCKRMKPIFKSLAHKYPEAIFLSVNSDEMNDSSIFQKYNVSAYPTFVFFDASGNVVKTQEGGASEADFDATIAAFIKKTVNP